MKFTIFLLVALSVSVSISSGASLPESDAQSDGLVPIIKSLLSFISSSQPLPIPSPFRLTPKNIRITLSTLAKLSETPLSEEQLTTLTQAISSKAIKSVPQANTAATTTTNEEDNPKPAKLDALLDKVTQIENNLQDMSQNPTKPNNQTILRRMSRLEEGIHQILQKATQFSHQTTTTTQTPSNQTDTTTSLTTMRSQFITPLYSVTNSTNNDVQLTTTPTDDPNIDQIQLGLISVSNYDTDLVPLLAYGNRDTGKHYYTTNEQELGTSRSGTEGLAGWICQGTIGFVLKKEVKDLGFVGLQKFMDERSFGVEYVAVPDGVGKSE
mmetsp:Transcript_21287/g.24107  ORF Transcript_21287/g.24107 Transcript_21287/m.24107 type:complete len:325 (+) Transcript_21287:101-1075(+)